MKYALVHNSNIKVGPRDYHIGFFEDYLKSINVTFNLPFPKNDTNPIVINQGISIVPVQELPQPSYHPVTEQLAGPTNHVTENYITSEYSVALVPIDAARNKMKEILATIRYVKENTIIEVTVQDTLVKVDTSRGSVRDFWTQTYLLMNDGDTKLVKFIDGNWLTLSKTDVKSIVDAIDTIVQGAFNWENEQIIIAESADKAGLETQYDDVIPKPAELNLV